MSSNIAEGFNRTQKQFINYLEIAKGSGFESENWYYKIRDCGFIDGDKVKTRIKECIEICKMLQSLIIELKKH